MPSCHWEGSKAGPKQAKKEQPIANKDVATYLALIYGPKLWGFLKMGDPKKLWVLMLKWSNLG
jgi:hypothetical protein